MPADNEVWILRHGEAEPATASDADRRLTPAGEEAATAVGRRLASLGAASPRILASPLVRAQRTARLAALALAGPGGTPAPVETDRRLAPGGDPEPLVRDLDGEGGLPALLVGHNPDLEELVFRLTGETVRMGTATLVRVRLEGGRGRLLPLP